MKQKGSILVGVLWCMVLLSLLVIGVLHTARMDLLVARHYGDRVQAHYLALAGVERAKALLYKDARDRQQSAKNHTGSMYNNAKDFQDVPLGRGKFQVFRRASQQDGGNIIYGVSDEESRLNLNAATVNELTNLTGMTADIVSAIITWRSASNAAGGANSDYYMSLRPPYLARNGPFQSVRELLMVRGVTSELLLGNDNNQNGFLDAGDEGVSDSRPSAPPSPGWSALLTVTDTDKNVNAAGKDRVNPQNADEATLTGITGITPDIAKSIVSYRSQHQLQTLDDLLSVTAQNQNQNQPNGQGGSDSSGSPVISQDLLEQIADDLTLAQGNDLTGMININTAGVDVLVCLPGVERPIAQAIVNHRQSAGYFANVAGLLKVDGMTRDIFKQVVPLITARSETYRITSEGRINSSGARQRIEEIVHIGHNDMETLGYREDL